MRGLVAGALCCSALAWSSTGPRVTAVAEYEIELRFTGYLGLAKSQDCDAKTNPAGYDVLKGTVSGNEPSQPDDEAEDVDYQGRLQRTTRIDFCQTRPNPTEDQVAWCVASLTGSAEMDVELTVYGSPDAGAGFKAQRTSRMATSSVQGDCTSADMQQIKQDYPGGDDGGGASPGGQHLEDRFSPVKFVVGGIPALRVGTFKPAPKQDGWVLTVVRKLR